MNVFFATMPRSGSEFAIKLTRLILNIEYQEIVSLTPGRMINKEEGKSKIFKKKMDESKEIEFIKEMNLQYMKVECPSADILCYDLSTSFSDAKCIASFRSIDHIIISHYNLKTWGWSESRILNAYINDLAFYEYMDMKDRFFAVNINEPYKFNLNRMLEFLDCQDDIGDKAKEYIKEWRIVNPLERQQKIANEKVKQKEIPPNLSTLRIRHPWLLTIENRYARLWEKYI